MTENEYIRLTNLTYLRMALHALHEFQPASDYVSRNVAGLTEDELLVVKRVLGEARDRLMKGAKYALRHV